MQNLQKQLAELVDKIDDARRKLKLDDVRAEALRLEKQMQEPDFWNDATAAADISQRVATLKNQLEGWDNLREEAQSLLELTQIGDETMEGEIQKSLDDLMGRYAARELELKLSGQHDRSDAVVMIYAGAGGTDAQDWAQMLERMFLRFAEAQGWRAAVVDESPGEEAGIKSATIEISGPFAYGKLKSERGVHRLVRLSPYNSDNLRQTSFAMVEVLPELEHPEEVEIDPSDLRIDVYRSGGHGGQSVNTTDSAVRITHLPTGLVVAIQNERSQLQNREKAMAILKSRLHQLMEQQHKDAVSELRGAPKSAEWGNQIRSYVLHPYTQVKDHRTQYKTAQAQAVLDGELEPFIEAYLQSQIGQTSK
jgi:peptide chain release factor 2